MDARSSALNKPLPPKFIAGLRWILLVPLCVAAWFAVLVLGIYTQAALERAFCPAILTRSGSCYAPWAESLLDVCIFAFGALSAIAVELAAWFTAPRYKREVLWLAFGVGTVSAMAIVGFLQGLVMVLPAIGSGALGAFFIPRWLEKPPRT